MCLRFLLCGPNINLSAFSSNANRYACLQPVTFQGHVKSELTLVVGPCSFSATLPCRLKDRSLQLTRTLFPNFSSNCRTSGSMPEKSSFCKTKVMFLNTFCDSLQHGLIRKIFVIIVTCVSGSKVKSFRRASLLILDSISLAVC